MVGRRKRIRLTESKAPKGKRGNEDGRDCDLQRAGSDLQQVPVEINNQPERLGQALPDVVHENCVPSGFMLVPAPDIDDTRRAVTTDRTDGLFLVTLMWEVQGNGMRPAPVKKIPANSSGWLGQFASGVTEKLRRCRG